MKLILEQWRHLASEAREAPKMTPDQLRDKLLAAVRTQAENAEVLKSTGASAHFTNTGSREARGKILSYIKDKVEIPGFDIEIEAGTKQDGSGLYRIYIVRDGRALYFVELKQGSEGKINASRFEENLVNALNASGGEKCAEPTEGAGEQFNELAAQVVSSIDDPALKGRCFKKLKARGTLTQLYVDSGVTSREPKTDIISTDGKVRISVKKKGGQFISAQGAETMAVFLAVVENDSAARNKLADVIKRFFDYRKGYAALKGKEPNEKDKIKIVRRFLLNRLLNFGGTSRSEALVREAALGEHKFADPDSVPNYFLVWDESGNGEFYEADKFIKQIASSVKFGVRGRGGVRGLALRADT